ncbi:MAG: hypothetical protein IKZ26_07870 [Peptococcaceae bacterium]|nr:hypothetical protein [Peptococcaceae bacterium]
MGILIALIIWLFILAAIVIKFHRDGNTAQQRLFSVFLIIWAILGIIYYDVLMLTTGGFAAESATQWHQYLPVVIFSICAGIGTYFLMVTFRKARKESPDDTAAQKKKSGKNSGRKK